MVAKALSANRASKFCGPDYADVKFTVHAAKPRDFTNEDIGVDAYRESERKRKRVMT